MSDRCVACGRPIVAVRDLGPPINLGRYVWRHYSRWANRSHHAAPSPESVEEFREANEVGEDQ